MPDVSQHLDMEALAQLRVIMGDEFSTLIETFENDSIVRIQTIRDAVDSGDPDEIRRAAHSFKGSASNMGAPLLTDYCRSMEERGHAGSTEGCEDLLRQIEAEYQQVKQALANL